MNFRIPGAAMLVALLGAAVPTLALAQATDTYPLSPYIQTVGDLDGDGLEDLVRVSGRTNEPTEDPPPNQLTAYRGTDGTELWSVDVPSWASQARAAKVGPEGEQGVILNGYLFTRATFVVASGSYESPFGPFLTGAAALTTGVVAVSGSGSVEWTRTFEDQTFLYPPGTSAGYAERLALFGGLLGSAESDADRVLISMYDRMPSADGQEDEFRGVVIDGADGSTASTSTLDVDSAVTEVAAAGDLSGDGLVDYTVQLRPYTDENEHSVVAFDGATGEQLWTLPLPDEGFVPQTRLGDVTGDGADDLAFIIDMPASNPLGDDVHIVDGSSGTVLSVIQGDVVRPTADATGDEVRDVLVAYRQQDSESVVAIYEVFRSDGRIVRHRSYEIPRATPQGSVSWQIRQSVGDIDGDGIDDLAHTLSSGSVTDARVVSGLDGRTIRTGGVDQALFASVDGHGDDMAKVTAVQHLRDVTVSDGLTGDLIWKVRLEPRGEETGTVQLEAADLTGDGRAEVIAKVSSNTTGTELPQGIDLDNEFFRDIWVLDGRDGSILWTLS